MLEKSLLVSGSDSINGFKLDGKFISGEPIPEYLSFEFKGDQNNRISLTKFENDYGCDLELVSVTAGISEQNQGEITLNNIFVILPPTNQFNQTPRNLAFYSNKNNPVMPYSFPKGTLIPKNAVTKMNFSDQCSYIRVIVVPRIVTAIGGIFVDV